MMNSLEKLLSKLTPDQRNEKKEFYDSLIEIYNTLKENSPDLYIDSENLGLLREELIIETDRGLCLFAIARLDALLYELLDRILVGSKTSKRSLFNNNGPLATFSSKIKICYSLGVISKDLMSEIDIFRTIRNIFAHSDQSISFDTKEISDECLKLKVFKTQTLRENRPSFITSFMFIATVLISEIRSATPFIEKAETLTKERVSVVARVHDLLQS
jgi:DNA-binding MltR family transcriptional regulator